MGTIVVRNLPEHLHDRLKRRAESNRRSMTKEAIHLIAAGLDAGVPSSTVRVADGRDALRAALIEQADGSFVNVLGVDDPSFFETLDRIRAEKTTNDLSNLFDDAA